MDERDGKVWLGYRKGERIKGSSPECDPCDAWKCGCMKKRI
jgi:hypothetical protein